MDLPTPCDVAHSVTLVCITLATYSAILLLSRFVISPMIAPKTYKSLAATPGEQGYWDSSVASTINGVVNTCFVLRLWWSDPQLLYSRDAFYRTDGTCSMVVIFMAWIAFDLAQCLYYMKTKPWAGQGATIVHHVAAFMAWCLYLEGGYSHALSLVGVFCEATNPFMNIRYFLSASGMKSSKLYLYNGAAFCLSWLLVRCLFAIPAGTYLIAIQWTSLGHATTRHEPAMSLPDTSCTHTSPMPVPHMPILGPRLTALLARASQGAAVVAPVARPFLFWYWRRPQHHLGLQALLRRL